MPLSEAQLARQRLGGLMRLGASDEQVAKARADLEYAKAVQAADAWRSVLTPRQLHQLSVRLLSGGDGNAT